MFQSAVIHDEYEFTGHNSALGAVCYNRHQDTFVSVDDACLRLWRAQTGGQLRIVSLPARTTRFIQAITYIDARQIFVASALDGALRLYDPNLNELAALFTGRGTVLSLVFDGQHNRLLTGGVDGCTAWQIKPRPSGMPEGALNAHYEFTHLPKFFHGTAVTHSSRNKPQPKSPNASLGRAGWVERLQLGPENTRLYAQTRHWIDVFNTVDGAHLERWDDLFSAEHGTLTAFVVQERAKYLVCGTSSGAIVVLSHHPITIVHVFKDHTQTITSLTEHAASRLVISSSLDGSVRLWDLEARRQAHRLNVGHSVHALQWLAPASSRATEVELALRNTVKIYSIQSILKEHQPCQVPVCVLQRVVFQNKSSDSDEEDESSAAKAKQLVLLLHVDPDEQALDLVAFALHPVSQRLFLLLSSQKLLIVNASPRQRSRTTTEDGDIGEIEPQEGTAATTSSIERVIDLNSSTVAGEPGYQTASVEAFMGADDHHNTTVSAGDFLDEKYLVLTVSVDAIVKVWTNSAFCFVK
ncbi:WD40 repeat, conserved site [Phytophthora cactorum]|nr:WD40 repeat, conserved site [Phytophthora cactorum]